MIDCIQGEMESLPDSAQWALERADGYMDLKMLAQAHQELESIAVAHREALPVQHLVPTGSFQRRPVR